MDEGKDQRLVNVILVYSKFSKACTDLFGLLKNYNLQSIDFISVDPPENREKILGSHIGNSEVTVGVVPSLILIYEDGTTNVYSDKNKVYDWFNALIEHHNQTSHKRKPKEKRDDVYIPQPKLINPEQHSERQELTSDSEDEENMSEDGDDYGQIDLPDKYKPEDDRYGRRGDDTRAKPKSKIKSAVLSAISEREAMMEAQKPQQGRTPI